MAKRLYPHNRIRYWYTYDLDEICALFADTGLHIQTIRGWVVKNGLQKIDSGKPILIYGYDLIVFLKNQNDKGKCQTPFNQMYCMKCKEARPVYQNKIKADLKGGFLKVSGHCRKCKTMMYKNYKQAHLGALRRMFNVVDVLELYDCSNPSVKTHIQTQKIVHTSESYTGDLFA